MQYTIETALSLFKESIDRMKTDTSRDELWKARLNDAIAYLNRIGVKMAEDAQGNLTDSMDDLMLVVDLAVWRYQNRDRGEVEPKWLRSRIGERWLCEKAVGGT